MNRALVVCLLGLLVERMVAPVALADGGGGGERDERAGPGPVHVTVEGEGTQRVTVPAGTYQATVVQQTLAETIFGHRVNTVVRAWLAPGIGPVQSEVLSKSLGGLLVRQELKSFTK